MRTLVIGGAGYVGENLVAQLVAGGHRVTVLGRSAVPRRALAPGAEYVSGDFADTALLNSLLDQHSAVIHLAYATAPNTAFASPLNDLTENLRPAMALFAGAAQRGIRLVFVSSGGTVYGEARYVPMREDHPTRPISPYGATKLTIEHYAHLCAASDGLEFVCVRPANAYGAGQRPFVGQGFISTAMASAMLGRAIKIFGARGTVRDYLYVSDLAAGIKAALEHGRPSETYNLGSAIGLSNLDVIAAMSPLLQKHGTAVAVEHLPERLSDVRANILDSAKLQEHTGWRPQTAFAEGLELTYRWLLAAQP